MTLPRVVQDAGWIASFLGADVSAAQQVGELHGIDLLAISGPKEPFVVLMSAGLAERSIESTLPQELLVTVQADQWECGLVLLQTALEVALDRGRGYTYGDLLGNSEPLLVDTRIAGLVADVNPWLPAESATRRDGSGVQTAFVSMLPLTDDELATLARTSETDRDSELEKLDNHDLLNLKR